MDEHAANRNMYRCCKSPSSEWSGLRGYRRHHLTCWLQPLWYPLFEETFGSTNRRSDRASWLEYYVSCIALKVETLPKYMLRMVTWPHIPAPHSASNTGDVSTVELFDRNSYPLSLNVNNFMKPKVGLEKHCCGCWRTFLSNSWAPKSVAW